MIELLLAVVVADPRLWDELIPECEERWEYHFEGYSLAKFPADADARRNSSVRPWFWSRNDDTWHLVDSKESADEIFRPGNYWGPIAADAVDAAKTEIRDWMASSPMP